MTDRLEQLKKLHEADPNDTFCTYGIALEYAKQGENLKAIEWLDKTIALDVGYCYAYYQKAQMLAREGDVDAARSVIDTGVAEARKKGDQKALDELAELRRTL